MHAPIRSHWRTAAGIAIAAACALAVAAALAPVAAVAVARPAVAASSPACATSGLVVWLDTNGNGAAGSSYYTLEFTNLSGHSCSLRGYPGVSAVGLAGHQLGSAGARNPVHGANLVTLAGGATATVVLRIVDAGNFPTSVCGPSTAAGLRVYPPGQTASKVVPYPFAACSRSGPTILSVEAVQAA